MRSVALFTVGSLALLLIFVFPATAQEVRISLNDTLLAIDRAVDDGDLTYEEGLVEKLYAVTGLPTDPAYTSYITGFSPPTCGTPVIVEVLSKWDELSPWAQDEIAFALDFGDGPEADEIPILPSKGRSVRPGHVTPNSYQTQHFNIKWGTKDPPSQSEVETLGEALEHAWDVEVDDLAYTEPYNASSYYVDVYIGNTGEDGENVPTISWSGGYATIYTDGDYLEEPYMAYFVLSPDVATSEPSAKDVGSHEFFHNIQFGVWFRNYPHGYMDDVSHWWWEATAVWMEDEVWPELNFYAYFIQKYMEEPELSLHYGKYGSIHQYAMSIWAKYLTENHGGAGIIKQLWNDPEPAGILVAMDDYFEGQGDKGVSSLKDAYREFLAKVAVLDFEEGELYGDIVITETVSDYPYLQEENDLGKDERPRIIGANFYRLRPGTDSGTLHIEFKGQDEYSGKDIDWNIMILGLREDGTYDIGSIETDDDNERGEIDISGFGTTYEEVWFAPSPYPGKLRQTDDFGTTKSYEYEWAADVQASDDDDDSGDDDDDDSGCCG